MNPLFQLDCLHKLFREEVSFANGLFTSGDNHQVAARILIRSTFAFYEGSIYNAKSAMRDIALLQNIPISEGELSVVRETEFSVHADGTIGERSLKIPFISNLKFCFKLMSSVLDSPYEVDYGGAGYQSLLKALKVRDRLMHPKAAESLEVTANECVECMESAAWFHDQSREIIDKKRLTVTDI